MGGRFLSRRDSTIVARHEVRAPKGLEDSAQGFNLVSTLGTATQSDSP
jgi:hypothetical protein